MKVSEMASDIIQSKDTLQVGKEVAPEINLESTGKKQAIQNIIQ